MACAGFSGMFFDIGGERRMKTDIYVTDVKNGRFLEKSTAETETVERFGGWGLICVFPEDAHQRVEGFGGAFTEAAASIYMSLSEEKRAELLEAYFDKEKGSGYSFCRTHIASCDFTPSEYTHIAEGDGKLETFSIERDTAAVIPMIKAAQKYGRLKLFASPWSPPAFMKDNASRLSGGRLKREYYSVWTEYVAKFIEAYRGEGIEIDAVTVQNEAEAAMTWESCLYTPQEECALIKSGFGERMRKLGVKIYVWDHNKERAFDRARTVFEDSEASQYVAGVACHWYTGDHFEQLEMIKRKYPDKEIIFSEGCCAAKHEGLMTEEGLSFAERYAHEIIGDFKSGCSAFCDWNLVLDMKNGPFNHRYSDLKCDAPIMADIENDKLYREASYYYIGHFSRFVKQGAVRISASSYTDSVEAIAFLNPDGEIALILLNRTDAEQRANVLCKGKKTEYVCPPRSITTMLL